MKFVHVRLQKGFGSQEPIGSTQKLRPQAALGALTASRHRATFFFFFPPPFDQLRAGPTSRQPLSSPWESCGPHRKTPPTPRCGTETTALTAAAP